MYSKIAFANSTPVFHRLRFNSSICIENQSDSIIALSRPSPTCSRPFRCTPTPVQLGRRVQLSQQQLEQPLSDSDLVPDPQPPQARHARAECAYTARKRIRTALPIRQRLATGIPEAPLRPRQQRGSIRSRPSRPPGNSAVPHSSIIFRLRRKEPSNCLDHRLGEPARSQHQLHEWPFTAPTSKLDTKAST